MKILVATVTAGGGHVAAAAALAEAWKGENPSDVVETVDLLRFFSKLHARAYTNGYVKFVETVPELWGAVFKKTDNPELSAKLRRWRRLIPGQSQRRFLRYVVGFKPDVLLCTHYLPLEALRVVGDSGRAARPFVVSVITDFEAHALWMADGVDLYCVAAEHTRMRLLARGADAGKTAVTGIPISGKFSLPMDACAVRRRMGLRDDLPVLLILSGGFGMGPIDEIVTCADKVESECQIVVVTGRNAELRGRLALRDTKHPMRVLGFAPNMHELMAISDMIITKPGGLTTSEALACGKPILVMNPIPGQEAANSDFLLEEGAACKVNRPEDLPFRLKELLEGDRLGKLTRAARELGRKDAAVAVCREAKSRCRARIQS